MLDLGRVPRRIPTDPVRAPAGTSACSSMRRSGGLRPREASVYWTLKLRGRDATASPDTSTATGRSTRSVGEAGDRATSHPPSSSPRKTDDGDGPRRSRGREGPYALGEGRSVPLDSHGVRPRMTGSPYASAIVGRCQTRQGSGRRSPGSSTRVREMSEFSEPTATVSSYRVAVAPRRRSLFSAPGRIRIARAGQRRLWRRRQAGHAQCCWSNGFVRVTVTPVSPASQRKKERADERGPREPTTA